MNRLIGRVVDDDSHGRPIEADRRPSLHRIEGLADVGEVGAAGLEVDPQLAVSAADRRHRDRSRAFVFGQDDSVRLEGGPPRRILRRPPLPLGLGDGFVDRLSRHVEGGGQPVDQAPGRVQVPGEQFIETPAPLGQVGVASTSSHILTPESEYPDAIFDEQLDRRYRHRNAVFYGTNQGPQVAMAMKDAAAMTCSHGSHENVGSVIMGLMRQGSAHVRPTARRRPHGYRQTDPGCWRGCGTGAGSLDLLPPWSEAATAKSWRSAQRADGPRQ